MAAMPMAVAAASRRRPRRRRDDGRDDDRDRGGLRRAGHRDRPAARPRLVPAASWPGLLAIGFVASFLAIQTFYAGARRIGAAQAALVSTVEPVYIVVLAGIFLNQRLEPMQLVGAGLILVGVLIAQTGPRPRGAPEPATPLEAEAAEA